jgi:hypothetical protein
VSAEADIAKARREYEASPAYRIERQAMIAEALIKRIEKAAELDHDITVAVLCAAAEELGAGMPELGSYRGEISNHAATWADCATPHELATYLAAGLAKVDRRAFARNTRKRLLVALWNSLPAEDRTAFIDFIEPGPAGRA